MKVVQTEPSRPQLSCMNKTSAAKVGTCGFGLSKINYARAFACVEVQQTFYQPPRIRTLEAWRALMPTDFEFTLKAWQLITHDAKSPTFRRLKRVLTDVEKQEAGYFRATALVKEAWETTLACARTLKARTILFQCPASFKQTKENVSRMDKFFDSIDRQNLDLSWEPRGDWDSKLVRSICRRLQLRHVVDPFVAETVTPDNFYFRLHGTSGWRYEYEIGELEELAKRCVNSGTGYVFFNNRTMTADALKFCEVLNEKESLR
jgi:uncharacterized protein YecE (DUF72 family)